MSRKLGAMSIMAVGGILALLLSITPIHAMQQAQVNAVPIQNISVPNLPATLLDPQIVAFDPGRELFALKYSIRNDSSDTITLAHVLLRIADGAGHIRGGELWTESAAIPAGSTKEVETVLGHKINPSDHIIVVLQSVSTATEAWTAQMESPQSGAAQAAALSDGTSGGGGAQVACDPDKFCAMGHNFGVSDCGSRGVQSFSCSVGPTCSFSYTCGGKPAPVQPPQN